jgi:uncharacterized protein YyaL (SSP411 family)
MISALAKASGIFEELCYQESAKAAMDTILSLFVKGGQLIARSHFQGQFGPKPLLEDYANLVNALIDLYESTFDCNYLQQADQLLQRAIEDFWNTKTGTFNACLSSQELLFNFVPYFDQVAPSALASITHALVRLEALTQDKNYAQKINSILDTIKPTLFKIPVGMLYFASALYSRRVNRLEMAVSGAPDNPQTQAILSCINGNFVPARTLVSIHQADSETKDRFKIFSIQTDETPSLYFCHQGHADEAITELDSIDYILRYYSESASLNHTADSQ